MHRLYISGSFWHWLEITHSSVTRFLCIVEWCRNALFWVTACPYMTHEHRTCWWDDPHNARPPHGTSPTTKLTHRSLGDLDRILQMPFLLIISQHWFRWWLVAVREQAIIWANVDLDVAILRNLGRNELNKISSLIFNNFARRHYWKWRSFRNSRVNLRINEPTWDINCI